MAACKNLKALYLAGIANKYWPFHDFITQFPLLEALVLDSCGIERVTISSSCLKSFRLSGCENLEEAGIEAPNLLSFQYEGDIIRISSTTDTCGEWEATLSFTKFVYFDSDFFITLRQFLSNVKHFKVFTPLLRFDEFDFDANDFFELSNTSTLSCFELEHLKLEIPCLSSDYPAVLDGLLWSCRPRMVTLRVTYELANCLYRTDFTKYLYEKLRYTAHTCWLLGKTTDHTCCDVSHTCCNCYMSYIPKHNANKVEIKISERALSRGRATDLSVLLDNLPTIVDQVIHFRISRLDV